MSHLAHWNTPNLYGSNGTEPSRRLCPIFEWFLKVSRDEWLRSESERDCVSWKRNGRSLGIEYREEDRPQDS